MPSSQRSPKEPIRWPISPSPNVPQFSVEVYQNEYLPEGGREVNAIVTVTSTGGGTTAGAATAAPRLPWRYPGSGRTPPW